MRKIKIDRSKIEAKLRPPAAVVDRVVKFKEQLAADLGKLRPEVAAGCCCCCCCCCCGDVEALPGRVVGRTLKKG